MKKYFLFLVFLLAPTMTSALAACPFTGYAWSDTIGWISLGGANYGLQMDTSGTITGFAWSDNIGWIQAGGLSGFPSGSGTVSGNAQLTSTSNITGWLKALSGGTPPDSQNGGWDGWISLGGTSPAYGLTRNSSTGDLSGYAWGDTNIGWVNFSYGKCSNTCTPSTLYTCSGQTVVRTDTSATCNVTTTNGPVCTPPANFCSPGSSTCIPTSPSFTPSGNLTGHLQVFPKLVRSGGTTQVYWNVDPATVQPGSCTVTSPNDSWSGTTSGPSGKTSKVINQQTTFTLTCARLDGTPFHETATANVVPVFQEI